MGVGILLGYLIFAVYSLLTPVNKIEIEVVKPVYASKVIGMLPSPQKVARSGDGKWNTNDLLKRDLNLTLNVPIEALSPSFHPDGAPALERIQMVFSGRGVPVVSSVKIEILQPMLETPSYRTIRTGQGFIFKPRIYYKGTGFYYDKKSVSFPDSLSADAFSLRTGAIFALVSILLFLFKSRQRFREWILKLKELLLESHKGGL